MPTGYPAQHDGIATRECNPLARLPKQAFTIGKLQAATAAVATGSFADVLLRAVQATLTDAAQAETPLMGRTLFYALDRRCGGQLAAHLGVLCQHPEVTYPHPWPGGLDIMDPNAAQSALWPCRRWSCRNSGGRWPESYLAGKLAGTGTAACASDRLGADQRCRSI